MKKYRLNEVFFSLQGEGIRAGTAAVFVRFAGCNLKCTKETAGFDCDTDHSCKMELTAGEFWDLIKGEWSDRPGERWVIFTGGEPALQLDAELLPNESLNWKIAVETNGTINNSVLRWLNWVTISPKPGHPVKLPYCDEYKIVVGPVGEVPDVEGVETDHLLLSPAFNGLKSNPRAIMRCVELVKADPRWRLSLQIHKLLGIR